MDFFFGVRVPDSECCLYGLGRTIEHGLEVLEGVLVHGVHVREVGDDKVEQRPPRRGFSVSGLWLNV